MAHTSNEMIQFAQKLPENPAETQRLTVNESSILLKERCGPNKDSTYVSARYNARFGSTQKTDTEKLATAMLTRQNLDTLRLFHCTDTTKIIARLPK